MRYRSIPGLPQPVSCLALGGWLTIGDQVDDVDALRTLRAAHDAGVNMIDLADVYADGAAEALVGRFVREVRPDQVILASKVFWPTSADPQDRGLTRRHIHASIDQTLRRLGVDRLDLYYCHREDPSVPLTETVEAMGDLVRAGKVAAWGTSCWRPRTLRRAHRIAVSGGHPPPRVEQSPYNLLERWVEADLVACCRELGMALVAYSPLAQGALTGKYLGGRPAGSRGATTGLLDRYLAPAAEAAVREYVALCDARSIDPAVAAIAWVVQRAGVHAAVLGARTEQQLRHNLGAVDACLDEEFCGGLDRIFRPARRSVLGRVLSLLRLRT
ncbi:MAG: aldo/keto reductase [Planctomycetota bacterium]|nr:aldo/keto reductase [Planctomycetota bacterium]